METRGTGLTATDHSGCFDAGYEQDAADERVSITQPQGCSPMF